MMWFYNMILYIDIYIYIYTVHVYVYTPELHLMMMAVTSSCVDLLLELYGFACTHTDTRSPQPRLSVRREHGDILLIKERHRPTVFICSHHPQKTNVTSFVHSWSAVFPRFFLLLPDCRVGGGFTPWLEVTKFRSPARRMRREQRKSPLLAMGGIDWSRETASSIYRGWATPWNFGF